MAWVSRGEWRSRETIWSRSWGALQKASTFCSAAVVFLPSELWWDTVLVTLKDDGFYCRIIVVLSYKLLFKFWDKFRIPKCTIFNRKFPYHHLSASPGTNTQHIQIHNITIAHFQNQKSNAVIAVDHPIFSALPWIWASNLENCIFSSSLFVVLSRCLGSSQVVECGSGYWTHSFSQSLFCLFSHF